MPRIVRWRLTMLRRTIELLGVGVTAGLAPQRLALLGKGLLQGDACAPGGGHHLVAGDLQQARVHRVGDGLLLHRGVDDQVFELGGLDGLGGAGRVDGGLEQFFHAGLADGAAKAPDLRGIARQAWLVERHAAEVLPDHIFRPALHQFLVAELVGVLEVQQAGHQPDGQARAACCCNADACDLHGRAEQIVLRNGPTFTHLAGKVRCQCRLDLRPGQPAGQHRQRVAQVDHLGQRLAEEISALNGIGHRQNSQESAPTPSILRGSRSRRNPLKPSVHAGR